MNEKPKFINENDFHLSEILKNSSFKDLPLNSKSSEWKPHSGDVIKFIEEVIKQNASI